MIKKFAKFVSTFIYVYMYRIGCPPEEYVVFDHVVFVFTGTIFQAFPRGLKKTCLDLL